MEVIKIPDHSYPRDQPKPKLPVCRKDHTYYKKHGPPWAKSTETTDRGTPTWSTPHWLSNLGKKYGPPCAKRTGRRERVTPTWCKPYWLFYPGKKYGSPCAKRTGGTERGTSYWPSNPSQKRRILWTEAEKDFFKVYVQQTPRGTLTLQQYWKQCAEALNAKFPSVTRNGLACKGLSQRLFLTPALDYPTDSAIDHPTDSEIDHPTDISSIGSLDELNLPVQHLSIGAESQKRRIVWTEAEKDFFKVYVQQTPRGTLTLQQYWKQCAEALNAKFPSVTRNGMSCKGLSQRLFLTPAIDYPTDSAIDHPTDSASIVSSDELNLPVQQLSTGAAVCDMQDVETQTTLSFPVQVERGDAKDNDWLFMEPKKILQVASGVCKSCDLEEIKMEFSSVCDIDIGKPNDLTVSSIGECCQLATMFDLHSLC